MKFGIDRLIADRALRAPLSGKRVALLAHPASVTENLTHSLDALAACADLKISAAFGPQHGLRGDKQDNMYEGQLAAAGAVRGALGAIAAAVEDAVPALRRGGRVVYVGAGTSARIGVQDGSELPPTYDWPADRVVFVIAGGLDALVRSIEGAEDNEAAGTQAIVNAKISADDVVIGVAASGTTPFTIAALRAAHVAD